MNMTHEYVNGHSKIQSDSCHTTPRIRMAKYHVLLEASLCTSTGGYLCSVSVIFNVVDLGGDVYIYGVL